MRFLSNIISVILFIVVCTVSNAQDDRQDYHRYYFSNNDQVFNLASIPSPDGGFYAGNVRVRVTQNDVEIDVNVSKHNVKGNLDWAQGYEIEDGDYAINFKNLDLLLLEDALYLVGGNAGVTARSEYFIFQIDPENGELLSSNVLTDAEIGGSVANTNPITFEGYENELNVVTSLLALSNGQPSFGFNHESYDENVNSTNSITYLATDTSGVPIPQLAVEATTTIDSNFVGSSILINGQFIDRFSLFKYDRDGEVLYSNQFGVELSPIIQCLGGVSAPDSSFVAVGIYVDVLVGVNVGFVFKTDTLGNVVWAKNIDGAAAQAIVLPNDVVISSQGEIVVSAKAIYSTGDMSDLTIVLDQSGNALSQRQYIAPNSLFFWSGFDPIDPADDLLLLSGDLSVMSDDALLYTTQGIDEAGQLLGPVAIKMDHQGASFCHDTFSVSLISDLDLIQDTLLIVDDAFAFYDTLTIEENNFTYNNTVLMLLDTSFCPQDPIEANLQAFVEGATDYIWSTGDTTDNITVFEEGEFSVTVTLGKDVCYMLCDTSTISVREFPEALINKNLAGVCELDVIALLAGSTTDVQSVMWSTGEMTPSIAVGDPGMYSVTITDSCDNTAEVSVNIDADEFVIPFNAGIGEDISTLCLEGTISLIAQGDTDLIDYIWSNGETTQLIEVDAPGTYTVTITSICNDTAVASITIEDSTFDLSFPLDLQSNNFNLCSDGTVTLVPVTSADIASYQWSNGEMTQTIEIEMPGGAFSVTVTDICGQQEIADIEVDPNAFELADPSVVISSEQNCATQEMTATGSGGVSPYMYMWSTGNDGSELTVDVPGTFTVTITDACGETGTNSISFTPDNFNTDIEITLDRETNCPPIMISANVSGEGDVFTYDWGGTSTGGTTTIVPSSGENTANVEYDVIGTYTLTVTSDCGTTATASIDGSVQADELAWPNIFFPTSTITMENQTFGPYVECPEFYNEEYKLEVFNRWGNKLFESTRIIDRWNGRKNNMDRVVQEDVYMYVWSYGEESGSGHVTLSK